MGAQQPWVTLQMDTGVPWSAGILMGMGCGSSQSTPRESGSHLSLQKMLGKCTAQVSPLLPGHRIPQMPGA